MNDYQPCTGYDAAVTHLCIRLEHIARNSQKRFEEILTEVSKDPTDPFFGQISHISQKYGRSIESVVDGIKDCHNEWDI